MTYGFGSGTPDPLVLNDGTFTTLTVTGTFTASGGGSLTGTWSDMGSVTTIDINGGTIDGAVIGGASAAAGTFTTFTSTGIDDNATSVAVTIDSSQNFLAGVTSGSNHEITKAVTNDAGNAILTSKGSAGVKAIEWYGVSSGIGSASAANAAIKFGQDGITSRSVNAAGTLNASGTDYAEYETKADGCGTLDKGDVVGFDANGNLTDVFANAVSFAIKSTNPSYVGGDNWHDGLERPEEPVQAEDETDEEFAARVTQWQADLAVFEAALEEKRQRVDRIAYAGKVPVNGVNGATPGHFVLAADNGSGGITATTKSSPTLAEYTKYCVGKVRTNGADGRAIVEVKMG